MSESAVSLREEAIQFFDGSFAEKVRAIPDQIMSLSEPELEELFRPTTLDFLIRKQLWNAVELQKQHAPKEKIDSAVVYRGLTGSSYFYNSILKNNYRMAWYFIPIHAYKDLLEDGSYHFIKKAREAIINIKVNDKNLAAFLKLGEFFINRTLGPVEQVIRQNTTQVNVDGNNLIRDAVGNEVIDKFKELATAAAPRLIDVKDPE